MDGTCDYLGCDDDAAMVVVVMLISDTDVGGKLCACMPHLSPVLRQLAEMNDVIDATLHSTLLRAAARRRA